jgi:putative ABC transport system ATP-binding protein
MLTINNLLFQYPTGNFSLDISEFAINIGEKVAVIGPSGSGKTTLLNLVSGITPFVQGEIRVGEYAINELNDAQRRDFRIRNIGFVFQEFELIDYLNVRDNILHPYRITPALKLDDNVRKRAAVLAGSMDIGDKLKRPVVKLSQGEKQRTAICRALLPNPKLILADEATGNLDPDNKNRILDLLFAVVEERQATLLAVTHDHELLNRFDRVIDFKAFQQEEAV